MSKLADYTKAEEEIDPVVRDVIRLLDAATDLAWSGATKRGVADAYLAWIITVQQISHTTHQE